MNTSKLEFGNSTDLDTALPASKRIYISGKIHPNLRVPIREIAVSENAPVRVYDTRGPWGDPNYQPDVRQGLPGIREQWIMDRGDTAEVEGRQVKPEDDGYLSFRHAARLESFPGLTRRPRLSSSGQPVTQLHYARKSVI